MRSLSGSRGVKLIYLTRPYVSSLVILVNILCLVVLRPQQVLNIVFALLFFVSAEGKNQGGIWKSRWDYLQNSRARKSRLHCDGWPRTLDTAPYVAWRSQRLRHQAYSDPCGLCARSALKERSFGTFLIKNYAVIAWVITIKIAVAKTGCYSVSSIKHVKHHLPSLSSEWIEISFYDIILRYSHITIFSPAFPNCPPYRDSKIRSFER